MTNYLRRPATLADAEDLAPRLQAEDAAEVWASGHFSPLEACRMSVMSSREPVAGLADGKVLFIAGIGVASFLGDIYRGYPWMLADDEIRHHGREFLTQSHNYIQEQRQNYAVLENYVDTRHNRAKKWLSWLGFTLEPAAPFGLERLPFHHFHMDGDI